MFQDMQYALSDLLHLANEVPLIIDGQPSLIMILSSAKGIETALIQDDNVVNHVLFHISENGQNLSVEMI